MRRAYSKVEDDGKIAVQRAGRFTSEDIHRALFGRRPPKPRSPDDMKKGIRRRIRDRHARH